MKVYFQEVIKQYENTNAAINTLIKDINEQLRHTELLFSHLIINGVEVYENHQQYLVDCLSSIKEVLVIFKSQNEVVADLQQSLNDYLERALPVMEKLSGQFYQGESEEAWNNFADLTDGLQWITSAIRTLAYYTEDGAKTYYGNLSQKIESVLQELVEALEAKDTVTIADLIQYELVEALTNLKQYVYH